MNGTGLIPCPVFFALGLIILLNQKISLIPHPESLLNKILLRPMNIQADLYANRAISHITRPDISYNEYPHVNNNEKVVTGSMSVTDILQIASAIR